MQVTIEEAYQEACAALGEALVRERLTSRYVAHLEAELANKEPSPEAPSKPSA